MKPVHNSLQRSAMTLAEVLIASTILGVGIAGLLSAASLALRNQELAEHRAAALYLAQEKLAEVEMEGPAAWRQGRPSQGVQEQQTLTCSWTLSIEPIDVGELYRVSAKVDWVAAGSKGQVQLETWLNDYEETDLPGGNMEPDQQSQRQVKP